MLPNFKSNQLDKYQDPINPQNQDINLLARQSNNYFLPKSKTHRQSTFSKKRSSLFNQSKNIKNNTKQSFQKQLTSITDFDSYIEKQYGKMIQQKSQNPTLMIPKGFDKFIHSKLFQNLLQKIYEYMDMLVTYQKKHEKIRQISSQYESQNRYDPSLQKMKHQTFQLQQKCKQISYIYMGILLSHGQCKMIFKDQYFFETMIYFIAQIFRNVFEEEDIIVIQEQLNRIFRTNAFNLIKRRNEEDSIYKKYPALKEVKYESTNFGIIRMIKRISIQKKFNYSMHIKPDKIEKIKKPIEIQLSSFGSVKSRSPLISSFYPSSKQKLSQFGKSARERDSFIKQKQRSTSLFFQKIAKQ